MSSRPQNPDWKKPPTLEMHAWPARTTMNLRGRLVTIEPPWLMGILNTTPDSFYQHSRTSTDAVVDRAGAMLAAGAHVIDLGGHSTRPGAETIPEQEERARVLPAIQALAAAFPEAIISVDTYRSGIARDAIHEGASIINDVTGGVADQDMFATAASCGVPYILMHRQGDFKTMQKNPHYEHVILEVFDYLNKRLQELRKAGVKDVIVDPGFGFGKSLEHNFDLLRHLSWFRRLETPILVGLSRKSMINKVLGTAPDDALNGTTVLHTLALLQGAHMLRVHDVKEAAQAVRLVNYYRYGNI